MSQPNGYFLYVAIRSIVMRGERQVCRAASNKEAKLIARALNSLTARELGRVHD